MRTLGALIVMVMIAVPMTLGLEALGMADTPAALLGAFAGYGPYRFLNPNRRGVAR